MANFLLWLLQKIFGFGSLEATINKDTALQKKVSYLNEIEDRYQGEDTKDAMRKAIELRMGGHAAKLEDHLRQKTAAQLNIVLSVADDIGKGTIPAKKGLDFIRGNIAQVKTEAKEIEVLAMKRKALAKRRRRQTKRQRKRAKVRKQVGKAEQKIERKIITHQQGEEQIQGLQQPAASAEGAEEWAKNLERQELNLESQEIEVENAEIGQEKKEAEKLEEERKAVEDAVKKAEAIQREIEEEERKKRQEEEKAKKIVQQTIAQVEQQVERQVEKSAPARAPAQSPQNLPPTPSPAPIPQAPNYDWHLRQTFGERGIAVGGIYLNGQFIANSYVGRGIIQDLKNGIIPKQLKQIIAIIVHEKLSQVGLQISPQYIERMRNANSARELFAIIAYIFEQAKWGDMQKLKQDIYGLIKDEEAIARMEQEEQTFETQERQEEHMVNSLEAGEGSIQAGKQQAEAQAAQAIGAEAQADFMNKDVAELAALCALSGKSKEKAEKRARQLRKLDLLIEMDKG